MMTQPRSPISSNKDQFSNPNQTVAPSDVLVFVDDSHVGEASLLHAQNLARALGGSVELLQVLCEPSGGDVPTDPVDWDIKKQQALRRLGSLREKSQTADAPCRVRLLEGKCSSQIKSEMEQRTGDVAAAMRSRSDIGWYLSETAWAVLMSNSAAVLMIPEDLKAEPHLPYRRILVPLDGSLRAEVVLPMAVRIAQAEGAELLLCYVAPRGSVAEIGSEDQEFQNLDTQVRHLNERAGRTYLGRTKKRLEHSGLQISTNISDGTDVRRSLIDIMSRESADFVIMATHGQSGHKDVPTGDVARFVLEKANIPVLLVRSRNGHKSNHTYRKITSKGVRQPVGTD